ncbi:MAG: alanine:cation symporter family protein, partial [Acidobacteria bacterium]|nr:alanine:cation symporter family protein [Acidobacteriota bacterium]
WVLTLPQIRGLQLVWDFADVMNGLMAFPNLVGLLLLSGVVAAETQKYLSRRGERVSRKNTNKTVQRQQDVGRPSGT